MMALSSRRDETWERLSACLNEELAGPHKDISDWEAVVELAEKLHLSPLLYRVLEREGRALRADLSARLENAYWANLRRNVLYYRRLAEISRACANANIGLIVLKGPAMVELAYPDVGARMMADLDLLVRERDFELAASLLEGLGYSHASGQHAGQTEAFQRRFHGEQVFYQQDQLGYLIELHSHLINFEWFRGLARLEMEGLWQRSRELVVDGACARQLAPEDALLGLCAHLGVHHCYGEVRMLVDVDRLIRACSGLDWELVARQAVDSRLGNVVYFALSLARRLLGTSIPEPTLRQLRPPAAARRVVDRLVDPVRVAQGESSLGRQGERFLHFVLVDRWTDRLRGLVRVFFPGGDWLAARYAVERRGLVALYALLHPLRMIWLALLGLGQVTRNV